MCSNNYLNNTETADLFNAESNKLEDVIGQFLKNPEELSISEIIELYYQVSNVISLVKFLRLNFKGVKNTEREKPLLIKIKNFEKYIDEKFDCNLHPLIMSKLKKSVEKTMNQLKDKTTKQSKKTKGDLEIHAKMYEKLRQIMSTKEFVDQYNKGLNNTHVGLKK